MSSLISNASLVDINDAWREYTAAKEAETEAANRVELAAVRNGIQHPWHHHVFFGSLAIVMSWYTARGDRTSVSSSTEHQLVTASGRKIQVRPLFRPKKVVASRNFEPGRSLNWPEISWRREDGVIRPVDADAMTVVGFDGMTPVHIAEFRIEGSHNWPCVGRGRLNFHDLIATQESDGCVAEQITDDSEFWVR